MFNHIKALLISKVWNGTVENWEEGEGEMAKGINPFIKYNLPPDNGNKQEKIRRAKSWAFRWYLISIGGIAKAHGIKVVLVSNVSNEKGKFTDADLIAGIAEHNRAVREVAQEQGAMFIDMVARNQQADQFVDPVRMNPAGSLQMAHIIAAGLLKGLL